MMEPTFTGYMRLSDAEALARGETVRVWLHPQEHVIQMIIPITWVRGRDGSYLLVGPPPAVGMPQENGLPEELLMLLAEASMVRGELVRALQSLAGTYQVPMELEERIQETYVAIGQASDRLRLQSDPGVQAKMMEELHDRFRVARNFLARLQAQGDGN